MPHTAANPAISIMAMIVRRPIRFRFSTPYSGVLQMRLVNVQVGARDIDCGATETARPSTGRLRR
jgi:hypothetical protein